MKFLSTFLFSLALTRALAFEAETTVVNTGCTVHERELSLGQTPTSPSEGDVMVDVYNCYKGKRNNNPDPLIVFAPGGGVPKSAYATFARGMAKKRFVVAVIEHNIKFSPFAPPLNFVNALDVSNTIDIIANSTDLGAEMDKVTLMGHSFGFGTVLFSLNEQCNFPFCKHPTIPYTGITVPRPQGIVLAAAYGASLNDRSGGFTDMRNEDIPVGIINGAGDVNYFNTTESGENLTTGSFARLNATKVIATIENLDHFSISEIITNTDRGDVMSTRDRSEQIAIVVDAMALWVRKNVNKKDKPNFQPTRKFCKRLTKRGQNQMNYTVTDDCLEEYKTL